MQSLIKHIRPFGSLITILGALIIFFSWVINNTLKVNYTNLSTAIKAGEREARLYGTLDEIEGAIQSLASEVVQPKLLERIHAESKKNTARARYKAASSEFDRTMLSAYQIRAINEFCAREATFSQTHSKQSPSSEIIAKAAIDASKLYSELSEKRKKCQDARMRIYRLNRDVSDREYDEATAVLENFVEFTRKIAIPKVEPIYAMVVPAVNARRRELTEIEAQLKSYAQFFSKFSIILYIVGTLLAITGKIIDKSPKAEQGSADQSTSAIESKS